MSLFLYTVREAAKKSYFFSGPATKKRTFLAASLRDIICCKELHKRRWLHRGRIYTVFKSGIFYTYFSLQWILAITKNYKYILRYGLLYKVYLKIILTFLYLKHMFTLQKENEVLSSIFFLKYGLFL